MTNETVTRRFDLPLEHDSLEFGRALGRALRAGDLVLLAGPLGAGKTVLVRGIADGMGVRGRVSSPTFVLARVHPPGVHGGCPLVHVDAYRLTGLDELDDLDLDSDLTESAVVVEWGEGFAERLDDEYLLVRVHRRDDEVREVVLEPHGESWESRVVSELPG